MLLFIHTNDTCMTKKIYYNVINIHVWQLASLLLDRQGSLCSMIMFGLERSSDTSVI